MRARNLAELAKFGAVATTGDRAHFDVSNTPRGACNSCAACTGYVFPRFPDNLRDSGHVHVLLTYCFCCGCSYGEHAELGEVPLAARAGPRSTNLGGLTGS